MPAHPPEAPHPLAPARQAADPRLEAMKIEALELVEDRETKEPAARATRALLEAARRNGLLIGKGGLYGNVIRISPPMNIAKSDVDEFVRLLDLSLGQAVGGN